MIDADSYLVIVNIKDKEGAVEQTKKCFERFEVDYASAEEIVEQTIAEFVDYNIYDDADKPEIWTEVHEVVLDELAEPIMLMGKRTVYNQIGDRIYSNYVDVFKDFKGLEVIKTDEVY